MKRIKYLFLLFFGIFFTLFLNLNAQQFKAIPIEIEREFAFVKVAWVSDSMFCIVADKEFNGNKFVHFVFFYNSSGKLLHEPIKFRSSFSSQDDYCFSMEETLFFIEDEINDIGGHIFRIAAFIGKDGILHDERKEIFYINHSKESRMLEKEHFSFNVYTGKNHKNALLTYNNDYADPKQEGFRFKILNSNGKISDEDTLQLPFYDRLCNMNDIIFDDEKMKIYILCNLFEDKDNKKQYLKSVFIKYDIITKFISETIDDMAIFSKCKVQHILKGDKLIFSGLKTDEADPSKWSAAFSSIDLNTMHVDLAKNFIPGKEYTDPFYFRGKLLNEFIIPIGFNMDTLGNLYAGWTKFFSLQQIPAMKNSGSMSYPGIPVLVVPSVPGLVIGIALLAGAALAYNMSQSNSPYQDLSLWVKYSPLNDEFKVDTINSKVPFNNYYTFSFSTLEVGENIYCASNSISLENKFKSTIQFKRVNDVADLASSDSSTFSLLPINLIYPTSELKTMNKNYIIGQNVNEKGLKEGLGSAIKNQIYLMIFE